MELLHTLAPDAGTAESRSLYGKFAKKSTQNVQVMQNNINYKCLKVHVKFVRHHFVKK